MHFPIPRRNAWGEIVPAERYGETHLPHLYNSTPTASPLVADSTNESFALKFAFSARYPRAHPARLSESPQFIRNSEFLSAKLACAQAILIYRMRILEESQAVGSDMVFNDAVAALATDAYLSASLDVPARLLHTWGTDNTLSWGGPWSGLSGDDSPKVSTSSLPQPSDSSFDVTASTGWDNLDISASGTGGAWVHDGSWGSGQPWGAAQVAPHPWTWPAWGGAGWPHFARNQGRTRRRARFGLRPRFPLRRPPHMTLARHNHLISFAVRLLKIAHAP
ncbi:hypothetical protein B0H11DRAFT_2252648 [Mycena galericulata]|nr:hypothetical protein B0H11DRAFT_2252648 [Mycena galericulata]